MYAKKFLLFFLVAVCLLGLAGKTLPENTLSASVSGNFFSSAVFSQNRYVLVGDRGRILLSDDAGTRWKAIDSRTKGALVSVCSPDGENGWAVGQEGRILYSPDQGRTWGVQPSGVDRYLLAVDFADANNGVVAGIDSTVLLTADGGKTWKRPSFKVPSEFEEEFALFAAVMIKPGHACIAGDYGRIFITEDAGENWIEVKSPLYDEDMMEGKVLYALAHNSGTLYGVGIDGVFVVSRDQGRTWTQGNTGFSGAELYCIDMVDGFGLAGGSGGHLIRTGDGGKTWQALAVPEKVTRGWLSGIALRKDLSGRINGLIVGEDGITGRVVNGKVHW